MLADAEAVVSLTRQPQSIISMVALLRVHLAEVNTAALSDPMGNRAGGKANQHQETGAKEPA